MASPDMVAELASAVGRHVVGLGTTSAGTAPAQVDARRILAATDSPGALRWAA